MPQKKPSKAKRTSKCHVCGDTGHYARDCKERKSDSEEVVLQDTTGKCHVCGETGHYARECKDKKSDTLKVVLQDTTRKCHLCGYTGHYARDCKEINLTRKCNFCGEPGHYARACKNKKSDNLLPVATYGREHRYKKFGNVRVERKEILGLQTKSNMKAHGWYLAIGSSAHVCYSRDMFVDYTSIRNQEVILDNKDHVDVAGIGTVVLRFTTGKVLTLSNVLHIPAISKCLVSVSKLDVQGYIMSLGGAQCIIKNSCEVIIGTGYALEDGAARRRNRDMFSTLFLLSLLEEEPVKKVMLDETIGLLASNEHSKLSKTRARGWYLLSRCTVHVCNSKDMFVDYQPVTGHEVVLENNSPVDVVGIGTVKLQLSSGKVLILENVFHMPEISKCCISVGKLTKMGFTVGFWGEGCDIKKDNDIVGEGYVEHELYRLSVVDEHPSADYDPMIDHEVNVDNEVNVDHEVNVDNEFNVDHGVNVDHEVNVDNEVNVDHEVNVDNEVNVDHDVNVDNDGQAKDSGLDMICRGRECVIMSDRKVGFKMYNDGVLYKLNLQLSMIREPTVVHHETIGLLIANEHPKLVKAKARRWYLLTRCTVHVCNSKDMFVDYQPVTGHEVVLENNTHVEVVGYGTVKLQLTTGNVLTLKNVFHMPTIVSCCISMKKLMEMGLGVAFHGEGCYVKKGQQILGNGVVEDGLLRLGVIDERSGGNQA